MVPGKSQAGGGCCKQHDNRREDLHHFASHIDSSCYIGHFICAVRRAIFAY